MAVVIMYYEAKCKHCLNCGFKKNAKNKTQSFCEEKKEFIRQKDKACDKFKL